MYTYGLSVLFLLSSGHTASFSGCRVVATRNSEFSLVVSISTCKFQAEPFHTKLHKKNLLLKNTTLTLKGEWMVC